MNSEIHGLALLWQQKKEAEKRIVDERRQIEDKLTEMLGLSEQSEGSKTIEIGSVKMTIIGRVSKHIDADLLQDIAAEHGLTNQLSSLFRWKPEINMKEWRNANEQITRTLSGAITTKPGRPSYSVTFKEQ